MTDGQNDALEYTTIGLSKDAARRIKVFADRSHRTVSGQVLVWLDAAEALMKDVPPDVLDKVDTVQNKKLRGAEPEG